MAINNLNSELQSLIRLQEVDQKMAELQERVRRIPAEIEQLESRVSGNRQSLDELEAELEQAGRERKRLEREVEDLRLKLSRYRDQLMEVKTNEAYQAMLHEIQFTQTQISEREDKILERMLISEELREKKSQAEQEVWREGEAMSVRKKELEEFAAQSEESLVRLQQQKLELEAKLPPGLIEQYRRIAARRNGMALAAVIDFRCQGCHVRLRPQLCAEIKASQSILTCENCNRILFYATS